MTNEELRSLYAGPAQRTAVSPISRTLGIVAATPGMISFACGNPANEALPVDAIAEAALAALREDTARALQYVSSRGVLAESLCAYVGEDGISATADNVLATTGSIQALALVTRAFIEPGDIVITEWPTYPVNLSTFKVAGARVIGVPMDDEGMRIDILERLLESLRGQPVKMIYTIPDAQNPTGITMSLDRRRALMRLADTYKVLVAEDAPYRGVFYAGESIPSVYAVSQREGGTCIYLGSFAKVIAPGLRVGFLVADPDIITTCALLKQGADFCTSGLTQLIVDRLLRGGVVRRSVARMREVQAPRLAAMLAALDRELADIEGVHVTRPQGGLFVWVTLPEAFDTDELLRRGMENKVAFIPGRYFYPPERAGDHGRPETLAAPTHELRLNFSDPTEAAIDRGIATLARLVREGA